MDHLTICRLPFIIVRDDPNVSLIDHTVRETFAEVEQGGGVKRRIFLKLRQPDKVLEGRVFRDLSNRFTVTEIEPLLDDEGAQRNTYRYHLFPCVGRFERIGVMRFNFPPRNEEGELNPPILLIQLPPKGRKKSSGITN